MSDDRYVFLVDWYDANAAIIRKYQLVYFATDSTVEMVSIAYS